MGNNSTGHRWTRSRGALNIYFIANVLKTTSTWRRRQTQGWIETLVGCGHCKKADVCLINQRSVFRLKPIITFSVSVAWSGCPVLTSSNVWHVSPPPPNSLKTKLHLCAVPFRSHEIRGKIWVLRLMVKKGIGIWPKFDYELRLCAIQKGREAKLSPPPGGQSESFSQ